MHNLPYPSDLDYAGSETEGERGTKEGEFDSLTNSGKTKTHKMIAYIPKALVISLGRIQARQTNKEQ